MRKPLLFVLASIGLLLATACDSNNNGGPSIPGEYETTEFVAQTDTGEVDALSQGAFIEMTVKEDSTVDNGVLFVPAELTGPDFEGDARIEFGGTWSRSSNGEITFDHEADTFIRDTEWSYSKDELRANTNEVTVTLTKNSGS